MKKLYNVPFDCLESAKTVVQREGTCAEPKGLPELRRQIWESEETKAAIALRIEYWKEVSGIEGERWSSLADALWVFVSIHQHVAVKKLLQTGKRTTRKEFYVTGPTFKQGHEWCLFTSLVIRGAFGSVHGRILTQ